MPDPASPVPARAPLALRVLAGLGLSTAILIVALVLLELGGLVLPALSREALDPDALAMRNARVQAHPYLAYAGKPGFSSDLRAQGLQQVSHNALGFRGKETTWEKPPGVFRIACLGGSSTYGQSESSDDAIWPARLEVLLNEGAPADAPRVEVINAGCQGYSTFESLINLELRVVDLEPDLVLVYHGINDMRCALYRDPVRDNTHWRAVWPVERPSRLEQLVQASTTFRFLRSLDDGWIHRRSQLGSYVIVAFDPVADQYHKSDPPTLGFDNVRRNLQSIVAVARAHGGRPIFMTQAMRYSDLDEAPSRDMQTWGLKRVQELLREVGAEHDVPVLDIAPTIEAEAARQFAAGEVVEVKVRDKVKIQDKVFTSEVHFTDAGSDLMARTVAAALVAGGHVPGRSR
jgi:lysophospholipase L1-like esterase